MKNVIAGLEEGLNAIADAISEGGGGGGGEGAVVPTPTLDDEGKVLKAVPQTQTTVAPEWGTVREVPAGGRNGQVLTANSDGYGWADASGGGGGGGHVDVVSFYIAKESFTQDGQVYTTAFPSEDDNIRRKINNIISLTIVDTADSGYPTLINPATGECSIAYDGDLVSITISSTVYAALGSREDNTFYMTYYKA